MAITAEQYSQAVLKAQLVNANDGDGLLLCEISGCPADWSKNLCQYRQIQGALFFLSIGDYVSDTAVYFYNTLLEIIGLKYPGDVVIDPNAQVPGIIIVNPPSTPVTYQYSEVNLLDAGGGNWYLPFLKPDTNAFPTGTIPIFMSVNGIQTSAINIDETFTPPRIFGFGGNYAQTILLTVVQSA